MPHYVFDNFIEACHDPKKIFITPQAKESAKQDFRLKTAEEILDFIVNDGLKEKVFKNTKPWENNPHKNVEVMVDAYYFTYRPKHGYLAFLFNPIVNKWFIKSFKLDTYSGPSFKPLSDNSLLCDLKNNLLEKEESKGEIE